MRRSAIVAVLASWTAACGLNPQPFPPSSSSPSGNIGEAEPAPASASVDAGAARGPQSRQDAGQSMNGSGGGPSGVSSGDAAARWADATAIDAGWSLPEGNVDGPANDAGENPVDVQTPSENVRPEVSPEGGP